MGLDGALMAYGRQVGLQGQILRIQDNRQAFEDLLKALDDGDSITRPESTAVINAYESGILDESGALTEYAKTTIPGILKYNQTSRYVPDRESLCNTIVKRPDKPSVSSLPTLEI